MTMEGNKRWLALYVLCFGVLMIVLDTTIMLAIYAIVNGNQAGWTSTQTLVLVGIAALPLVVFLAIEARVRAPLVPLRLFRLRNLATANVVGILWAAAMFSRGSSFPRCTCSSCSATTPRS